MDKERTPAIVISYFTQNGYFPARFSENNWPDDHENLTHCIVHGYTRNDF